MSLAGRLALAPELRDTDEWPSPDVDAMDEDMRAHFLRRKDAIVGYLQNERFADIAARTGVAKSEIYRMLDRCLRTQVDGTQLGFFALVPGSKCVVYRRRAPAPCGPATGPAGLAGAFLQLMHEQSALRDYIEKSALRSNSHSAPALVKQLHAKFLQRCARVRGPNEYPFTTADRGRRALRRYLERFLFDHYGDERPTDPSDPQFVPRTAQPSGSPWLRPFEEVEHDGHCGDFYFVIKMPGHHGEWIYTTPMKIWLLLPICRGSHALLSYAYKLGGTNYPAIAVMRSIAGVYKRWKPRELTLPHLAYKPGAGFPSGAVPATYGVLIDLMCFDNAWANTAGAVTMQPLVHKMGATVNYGRAGEPTARAFVERLNLTLEQRGFHRLPIGFNPKGPKAERERAIKEASAHAITSDELEQILDVMLANQNAEPHSDLINRSSNEYLAEWFAHTSAPVRRVANPEAFAKQLLRMEFSCSLHRRRHGASYIHLLGARYTNDVVAKIKETKGLRLRAIVDIDDDVRFARGFLRAGDRETDIGVLRAMPPWHLTPHTLQQRQLIGKANRQKKIPVAPGSDLPQAFAAIKKREAVEHRAAANELAALGLLRTPRRSELEEREAVRLRALKKNWVSIK